MIPLNALLFTFLLSLAPAHPAPTAATNPGFFRVFDLPYTGELLTYHAEDLNNDQRQAILIFSRNSSRGRAQQRWLSLYLQSENGFADKPSQILKLPQDLILYDTGDVAGDAKKELLYFAAGEVRYLQLGKNSFVQQPQTLFKVESIFMASDRKTVRRWDFVRDFNGDGADDVFVQQFLQATLFLRQPGTNDWRENTLPLRTQARVYGYFDPRFSVGHKSDALYSTPYILLEDFNMDGHRDLLGIYKDSLVVFPALESGTFSAENHFNTPLDFGEIWTGAKIQRTHLDDKSEKRYLMRIKDLNNDGLLDIVSTRLSTRESLINPKSEVRIHFGRKSEANGAAGVFFQQQPDQIIRPDGSMMVLDILDINNDQRDDLVIPSVNIGVAQIIKMLVTRSVSIEAAHYLMRDDSRYPEKPDGTNTLNVKFSFKGGAASPVYEIADFNNDGLLDVLSSSDEERLLIYWGEQGKLIQNSAGEKFAIQLPQDGTLVRARDLNNDQRADVIIAHDDDDRERKRLPRVLRVLMAEQR